MVRVELIVQTGIRFLLIAIGAPLNLHGAYKLLKAYYNRRGLTAFLLLKLHLSIADLMILIIYNISSISWQWTDVWYGGSILCSTLQSFNMFSFYLSSNVIACIATERLMVMCLPYSAHRFRGSKYNMGYQRAKVLLSAAYILAFICSVPHYFMWVVEKYPGVTIKKVERCTDIWFHQDFYRCYAQMIDTIAKFYSNVNRSVNGSKTIDPSATLRRCMQNRGATDLQKVSTVLHLMFVFWLPCIVVLVSSAIILKGLSQRMIRQHQLHRINRPSLAIRPHPQRQIQGRSTFVRSILIPPPASMPHTANGSAMLANRSALMYSATLKRTMCLCTAYLLCWLPYNVMTLGEMVSPAWFKDNVTYADFLKELMIINAAINPLIYSAPHPSSVRAVSATVSSNRSLPRSPNVNSEVLANGYVNENNTWDSPTTLFPPTHSMEARDRFLFAAGSISTAV